MLIAIFRLPTVREVTKLRRTGTTIRPIPANADGPRDAETTILGMHSHSTTPTPTSSRGSSPTGPTREFPEVIHVAC